MRIPSRSGNDAETRLLTEANKIANPLDRPRDAWGKCAYASGTRKPRRHRPTLQARHRTQPGTPQPRQPEHKRHIGKAATAGRTVGTTTTGSARMGHTTLGTHCGRAIAADRTESGTGWSRRRGWVVGDSALLSTRTLPDSVGSHTHTHADCALPCLGCVHGREYGASRVRAGMETRGWEPPRACSDIKVHPHHTPIGKHRVHEAGRQVECSYGGVTQRQVRESPRSHPSRHRTLGA